MAVNMSTILGPGLERGSCICAMAPSSQSWSHLRTSASGTRASPSSSLSPSGPRSFTANTRKLASGRSSRGTTTSNVSSNSGNSVLAWHRVRTWGCNISFKLTSFLIFSLANIWDFFYIIGYCDNFSTSVLQRPLCFRDQISKFQNFSKTTSWF